MTKQEFKDHYVAVFLASYMASRYDSDCQNGHINEPYDHQPLEDAMFLAEKAWESKLYYAKINSSSTYGKIGIEE